MTLLGPGGLDRLKWAHANTKRPLAARPAQQENNWLIMLVRSLSLRESSTIWPSKLSMGQIDNDDESK